MLENNITKNNTKRLALWLLVSVLFFVGAFTLFGKSFFASENTKEIEAVLNKAFGVESFAYSYEMRSELSGMTPEGEALIQKSLNNNFMVSSFGFFDLSTKENTKADMSLSVKFGALDENLDLKLKLLGKDFYLLFVNLPKMPVTGLADLTKSWIRVDEAFTKQFLNTGTEKEIELGKLIAEEQKKLIKESFYKNKVLEITKKIKENDSEVENAEGYEFTFNKKGVKSFLDDIDDISGNSLYQDPRLLQFVESIENAEMPKGEVYFDTTSGFFKKLNIVFSMPTEQGIEISIYMDISFDKINEKFEIETPKDYIKAEDLMKSLNIPLPAR